MPQVPHRDRRDVMYYFYVITSKLHHNSVRNIFTLYASENESSEISGDFSKSRKKAAALGLTVG